MSLPFQSSQGKEGEKREGLVKAQLSKRWESKVRAVNNFRVLARLPLGELGRALYPSAQAHRRAGLDHTGTHRTDKATRWLEASNKDAGRPRPGDTSRLPRSGTARRGRGQGSGPTTRSGRSGPRSPRGGHRWGPGGDTPTPPPQAGGGDALPSHAAQHRRSPRDRAGGGDAVTCRGLCRSPPAPLSWQPQQPHEGRQPRAW